MHHVSELSKAAPALLFDWKRDVERLEREARSASRGAADPFALAEAECSLDLLDNELLTLRGKDASVVAELQALRGRLVDAIARLQHSGLA